MISCSLFNILLDKFLRQISEGRILSNSEKTSLWLPYQPSSGRQTLSLAFYSSCSRVSTKRTRTRKQHPFRYRVIYRVFYIDLRLGDSLSFGHRSRWLQNWFYALVVCVSSLSTIAYVCVLLLFCFSYSMHPRDRLDRSSRNESDRLTRSGLDARQD